MATRFSNPAPQFLDANGDVYASGKLVFYDNGTTTPKNVYSDVAGSVSLGNELTLDASGRVQSFYGSGTYRVRLLDSSDVQIWERDDVIFDVTSDNQFNDWDSATTYAINDVVQGSDGNYYISLTNSNLNNNPITDLVNWSQVNLMESYNANKTYSVGDLVIASDGYIYRSKVNSNINNDPTVSPNEWGTATSTVVASAYPKGYLYGFEISKDGGDPDHDISIAEGAARDSTDTANISTNAAFIKRIDANWTEGTNGGGFPSALSLTADTTYNVFVLLKDDETAVDGGFDTSSTAANLLADATDYDKYRKIGEVTTDASSNLDVISSLSVTLSSELVKITQTTASNDATIDFTGLDDQYSHYVVYIDGIVPQTDQVGLYMRLGYGSTPTWYTGASDYGYASYLVSGLGTANNSAATASFMQIMTGGSGGLGTGTNEEGGFVVTILNPSDSSISTNVIASTNARSANTYVETGFAGGYLFATTAITALRFYCSSGNIASGRFTLYGIK